MTKRGFALFVMSMLLGANAVAASTVCEPSSPNAATKWTELHIKADHLQSGRVLLGLDGSRVTVNDSFAPIPGGLPATSPPWHTLVDWQKYKFPASSSPAFAVLYLDADEKGKRYLCRIDTRQLTEAFGVRMENAKAPVEPGPGDIHIATQTRLSYDARKRVAQAVELVWDEEKRTLKQEQNACFHYNETDGFLGSTSPASATCATGDSLKLDDRYVYQADGNLLRRIHAEKRMPGPDGKPFVTNEARVIVYDERGEPAAEYVDDEAKGRYRRSIAANDDLSKYYGIKLLRSPEAIGVPRGFWQFHSTPTRIANRRDRFDESPYLVAGGDGKPPTKADRARIWQALSRLDHDLVLDGQGKFLIVPEVSAVRWAACTNPQLVTRDACP